MTKTATELFNEYYLSQHKTIFKDSFDDCEDTWNHQQKRIDELQRQLDTANFFRNGDSATIGNATHVIKEMRSQIDELERQKKFLIGELYVKSDAINFNQILRVLEGEQ